MNSRKVALTAAFLALAAGGTAACDSSGDDLGGSTYESDGYNPGPGSGSGTGSDTGSDLAVEPDVSEPDEEEAEDEDAATDEVFYCADEEGEIVDEEYCDDDESSLYFLWYSPNYARGLTPGTYLDGGDYFSAGDRKARRAFKLPATGKVGNGTVKTNVVGRSSVGSGISTGTSGG